MRMREEAVCDLGAQPQGARATAALETILREENHPVLLHVAHDALKRQSPEYGKAVDARAREQGIARARVKADGSA